MIDINPEITEAINNDFWDLYGGESMSYYTTLENYIKLRDGGKVMNNEECNCESKSVGELKAIINNLISDKRDLIRECLFLSGQSERTQEEIEFDLKRFRNSLEECEDI
ncbi:MAG: hypothetical protein PF693_10895 [Spirochaetia bacterium]|jgi:hypothetical protein|nr:hypothetical protein [Spirochaetia bacterium]